MTTGQHASGWTAKRLHALLESCPVGVQECDTSGVITFSNAAHAKMHGYAPGELVGRTIYSLVDSTHAREELAAHLAYLVAETPMPTPYVTKGLMKNRQAIDVRVDWDYLCDAEGAVVGFASIINDVTAHEQNRAELEDRVADTDMRFRSVFETARDGIIIADAQGRVLEINASCQQFCELSGSGPGYGGATIADLFQGASGTLLAEQYTELMAGLQGTGECFEFRVPTTHGDEIWLEVSPSAARDEAGHIAFGLLVVRNITESKQAREHQAILNRELDHRVKNTLATILALLNLSLAEAQTLEEFGCSFRARVQAMAKSHCELARRSWLGLTVGEILSAALQPFSACELRVSLEGPSITLSPEMALPFALSIHELVTNAAKHGALSTQSGRLQVSWRSRADGGTCIEWIEHGGATLDVTKLSSGLGLRLVRVLIEHEIRGEAQFETEAGRLKWSLYLP